MYEPLKYVPQTSHAWRMQEPVKARRPWSWMDFAKKFVPATICLWSLIMVSGVVLGCVYGSIY